MLCMQWIYEERVLINFNLDLLWFLHKNISKDFLKQKLYSIT